MVMGLLDSTYTAFKVPIAFALSVNRTSWSVVNAIDLVAGEGLDVRADRPLPTLPRPGGCLEEYRSCCCLSQAWLQLLDASSLGAGACFTADMVLKFHTPLLPAQGSTRTELVTDGRAIAWAYLLRGSFAVDFLATWPAYAEVRSERTWPHWLYLLLPGLEEGVRACAGVCGCAQITSSALQIPSLKSRAGRRPSFSLCCPTRLRAATCSSALLRCCVCSDCCVWHAGSRWTSLWRPLQPSEPKSCPALPDGLPEQQLAAAAA